MRKAAAPAASVIEARAATNSIMAGPNMPLKGRVVMLNSWTRESAQASPRIA